MEQSVYLEEGFPFKNYKLKKIKAFLSENDLTYDEQIQYTALLCDSDGRIVGCGSRHENTLKCIAIDPNSQGEGYLQQIVTQLVKQAYTAGYSHLFLFTKPEYRIVFGDMGFYPIMETADMLLMENRRNGISLYLEKECEQIPAPADTDIVGAIVMNANPFTLGHRYLVETASKSCDILHVFVLSTDSSEFPADIRLELVKAGCTEFENVYVHGSSDYLISHATFPDYFLKDKASASDKAATLDLMIFGKYYKETFYIKKRFVGEEPFSDVTRAYNTQMKQVLPPLGIEVTEIPRTASGNVVISATYVRKLFLEGDFENLKPLVPETTYAFLISKEGQSLRKNLIENR